MAPPGPPSDLSLPSTIPTAWQVGPKPESGLYVNAGAMGLQRQKLGNSPFVLRDNTINLDNGFTPILRATSPVLNFNDIRPDLGWGFRGTVGYLYDDAAIEITGFYLPQTDDSVAAADVGRLHLFFNNPPLGFEGDNGLWLQADFARATIGTALGNLELNYRWWSRATTGFEGIIGVRYMDVQEKLSIFTDDDGISIRDVNDQPDPNRQATYNLRAHNHILGPQVGVEWFLPLLSWVNLGTQCKGAWGANWIEVDAQLQRGDGLVGRQAERSDVDFAHLYEMNFFFDFTVLERMRIRAGYNCLWVVNVAEAVDNISYDLRQVTQPGPANNNGAIFYHGPIVEMMFFF
jgi:hypothetical protein